MADNVSSIQITPDNKYLICSSQTSKDQGGGIIYLFTIEHDSQNIKRQQSNIERCRNVGKVIVVDQNNMKDSKSGGLANEFD